MLNKRALGKRALSKRALDRRWLDTRAGALLRCALRKRTCTLGKCAGKLG